MKHVLPRYVMPLGACSCMLLIDAYLAKVEEVLICQMTMFLFVHLLQLFYKASKERFDNDAEFKDRAQQAVVRLQVR